MAIDRIIQGDELASDIIVLVNGKQFFAPIKEMHPAKGWIVFFEPVSNTIDVVEHLNSQDESFEKVPELEYVEKRLENVTIQLARMG